MVDSTQLERLNLIKGRALVEKRFPNQDFHSEAKNSAAFITSKDHTFVYAHNENVSALAIALTIPELGSSWNLILNEPDHRVRKQIAGLQSDCSLWVVFWVVPRLCCSLSLAKAFLAPSTSPLLGLGGHD